MLAAAPARPTASRLRGGSAARSIALKPLASVAKPSAVGWISSYQKPPSAVSSRPEKSA